MNQKKDTIIREYWLKKLSGELPKVSLPLINPVKEGEADNRFTQPSQSLSREIPPPLTGKLIKAAKNSNIALFILVLTGLNIVLSRYTGVNDLVVGTTPPAANENKNQVIFCRNPVSDHITAKEFIMQTKKVVLEAINYSGYSLENMIAALRVKNDTYPLAIFNTAFIYEPFQSKSEYLDRFELVLILSAYNDQLRLRVDYPSFTRSRQIVKTFSQNLIATLNRVIENPTQEISRLDIVSPEEKERLLYDFNHTEAQYPQDKTIHELFEEQVEKKSDRIALIGVGMRFMASDSKKQTLQVTYGELNQKSTQLAHRLRKKGLQPDTIVAIMVERSLEMVVGIFGILKAGSAYLPIDPEYPPERINYILEDSQTQLLLTQESVKKRNKAASKGTIIDLNNRALYGENKGNLSNLNIPGDLAYSIYTSGSTGRPKGVLIEHSSMVNVLAALLKQYPFSTQDTYLLKTTYVFDVSITELFGWFLGGGRLAILNRGEEKDPEKILDTIEHLNITHINFVPSMFNTFLDILNPQNIHRLLSLKYIFLAGEALLPALVKKFNRLKLGILFENIYGPTESTIYASSYSLSAWDEKDYINIPIGKPFSNIRLYVLDKYNHLQPAGVPGELCISGLGLARGYLNHPELTAEKFHHGLWDLQDYHNGYHRSHMSSRSYIIYKTGDLARWLIDGNIEFIGRLDYQFKIRGFRVELGEIENQILTHEAVKETVVTTIETMDDKRLCAYIVPQVSHAVDSSKRFKTSELKDYLSRRLPGYMIPSFFVLLDQVPLTPNGKVDRKALPAPKLETGADYVAPRNPIEEKLVDLWSSVLEIERGVIGIDSNFFDLGGHSLKVILVISRIHKAFHVKLSMGQVFKAPVVRKLAAYIKEAVQQDFTAIAPVEKKAYYRLSSAQKRLYILNEMEGLNTTYNMPTAIRVEGQPDKNRFQKTLQALIKRHESLRTSFRLRAGKLVQIIQEKVDFKITCDDFNTGGKEVEILSNFVKPFDLSKAPLLRVGLIWLSQLRHIFIFDTHHIVSDGLSMDILVREFVRLYNEITLPALNIQYKDFSEWQNQRFESGEIEKLKIYWLEKLSGEIPSLNIPGDYPRPDYQSFAGNTLSFSFSAEKMEKLNSQAKENNITLNFLFLSLYFLLLSKYSNQDDIIIGSLVAGRNHPDLEHVMGMFGNFLPIRCKIDSSCTFPEFLVSTGKTILEAYENQDYPFEEIIDLLNLPVTLSRNPLFDTMFIFHNEVEPTLHLGIDDLIFTSYPLTNRTSKLDFKIDAFLGEKGELNCNLEYNVNLFKEETIKDLIRHFNLLINEVIENPNRKISGIELFTAKEKLTLSERWKRDATSTGKAVKVAVSATFTSEPIKDYIIWWGKQFGLEVDTAFAPYNQVFQELLDETGMISSNPGINILLVRFEDWIRDLHLSDEEKCKKLGNDFNQVLKIFKDKPKAGPYFVGIFPAATHLYSNPIVTNLLENMYKRWKETVESLDNVYVMDFTQLNELYAFDDIFDPITDKEGHLPFSSRFYAAMGAVIARNIRAIEQPPFKVIALDCDNTLWNGICGEDGALGVRVDPPYWELQQLMVQKYHQGFLLALCSKNNEADVWEVFEKNPGMLLKKDYFVSWKINWKPKSANIKELANELNLGINGFILLDDSPVESSEVMTHCPEVLTLQLPEEPGTIPHYLKHVWAFDKIKVTDEDRSRTQMYRAEKKRKESQTQSQSLTDFLAGLQLKISMNLMKPHQVSRVSQLTLRTNQFNLSTIRRNEDEIIKLTENPGTLCWVVEVSDRFGDYGLVGVVITKEKKESLFIDTLLLSCRVLGRGVEEALLAGLRKYCQTSQIKFLEANYYPTPKNKPLLEFLQRKWIEKEAHSEYRTFIYPYEGRSESVEYADIYYRESLKPELPQETTPPEKEDILLDHIAVAVNDLKRAVSIYRTLGYTCGDITYDPMQRSNLVMCHHPHCDSIELVAAADSHSPTNRIIAKNGDIPYHFCYRTKNIKSFLKSLAQQDISFEIIDDLKPAVLFDYKKVMFLQVENVGLMELLEDQDSNFFRTQQEKVKRNAVRVVVGHPEPALAFFKLVGYDPVKSINNGKRLEITLAKTGASKIQLLVPTKKAVKELEFLNQNGPHLYQLCFDEDNLQKPAGNWKEIDINVDYIRYINRKDSKQSSGARYHWHIKATNIHQLVHSNQLLPLENYTADMLLGLPTYRVNESITSRKKYDPPGNQWEIKLVEIWQKILRMERIGINETFFELGGNSLKAITLISEIHKMFNVELSLKDIFKSKTIKELSQRISNSGKKIYSSIKSVEKKYYYAVSSAQNRLFILQHMAPRSTGYNISSAVELEGDTSRGRLQEVFGKLIRRHESLRTSFKMVDEVPVQRVHDDVEFEIEYYQVEEGEAASTIKNFVRPFDLSHAPLLRMGFIRLLHSPTALRGHSSQHWNEDRYLLMVDMHHIITDGVSFDIFVNDFMRLYAEETLQELKIQYKDFSQFMNKEKEQKNLKQQEEYWLKEFVGEIPVLTLPTDYPRPEVQSFEGDRFFFEIDGKQYNGIKKIETKGKATLYMVLLTIYNVLLSKLSGQEDIVVGSPTAGRRHPELQPVIGMFVNTLSLRNSSLGEKRFSEFLGEIKERTLLALENQDYPFEDLVREVAVKRDASRNPLFDTAFVLQNMENQEITIPGLLLKPYPHDQMVTKFDLTLTSVDTGKTLFFTFEFCTRLFNRATIEKFKNYFINIVSAVIRNPQGKISGIDIITREEKSRILNDFNDTRAEYPKDKVIYKLFEEQVEKTPDHIALIGKVPNEISITYKELNEKSHRLAFRLIEKGVKPDSIVAIMVERSPGMIVAIMAILKAGGAYLPIEPDYPEERIQFMLQDSSVGVLVTAPKLQVKVKAEVEENPRQPQQLPLQLININTQLASDFEPLLSILTSTYQVSPANLAYIIYTSGSTGIPKGVMIEHQSVVNRLNWMQQSYPIGVEDIILQKTPFIFDVSVWELFWWSMQGAAVYLLGPGEEKDPAIICEVIEKNKITTMHFVPSMLNAFLDYIEGMARRDDLGKFRRLRQVFASGETLRVHQVKRFNGQLSKINGTVLVNLYGPTEATVDVSYFNCLPGEEEKFESIPIGCPIDNIRLYVMDRHGNLQPIGVIGELCIAGDGLARGYLNRPELTAVRFIKAVICHWSLVNTRSLKANDHSSHSPIPPFPHSPIYLTGDLARWLSNGNIEFLGRIDHQVKIRGFRIEPGEIETHLLNHEAIRDVVVLVKVDPRTEKYLCAYIVAENAENKAELLVLREYLSEKLPDYMIPRYFIYVDEIPLTPHGKLDRRALPSPRLSPVSEGKAQYKAPSNVVEQRLVEIWSEVLDLPKSSIGINDNFFELGGHSLKATIMIARIHREFNVKLPLVQLFKTPVIKKMAGCIKNLTPEDFTAIESAEEKEYYPLSSTQERFYFLQQLDPFSTAYNITLSLRLEGSLDRGLFESAFRQLIRRHDVLRTSFYRYQNQLVQRIHRAEEVSFQIDYLECRETETQQAVTGFIRPFDLEEAPTIRVGLIKTDNNANIMVVDIHHIASDGISHAILANDFLRIYRGEEPAPLFLRYRDYSQWQIYPLFQTLIARQEKYWLQHFEKDIPKLEIPTDYPRSDSRDTQGEALYFAMGQQETQGLKTCALDEGVTLQMLTLAILFILLSKISSQEDIVIGFPIAGRRHRDLHSVIGPFINTIPLRCFPSKEKTFIQFLEEVKENCLDAYENQEYPFENLVKKRWVNKNPGRNPFFDVMFELQGDMQVQSPMEHKTRSDLKLAPFQRKTITTIMDLDWVGMENHAGLSFSVRYSTSLFKRDRIQIMVRRYREILEQVLENREVQLGNIMVSHDFLTARHQLDTMDHGDFEF